MTDRRTKRLERLQQKAAAKSRANADTNGSSSGNVPSSNPDEKFSKLIAQKEDVLLNFVAEINKIFTDNLGRPAPFVSFVICGMQSSGKSTIMERFLNAPLNIVQEGTGTRCPLDTTCIHDSSLTQPRCELSGLELAPDKAGTNLSTEEVFETITEHNRNLGDEDKFSTEPLRLIYRANNVQNMRFVDTPGIIANQGTGRDNRDDIKGILRDVMKKPNSKLCVLVEPKEFSTNTIIDFCDETFHSRGEWSKDAIILMTKFDKNLEDSRSGSKANKFFSEYHDNGLFPYLTITPTLTREDLSADLLYAERLSLLESATSKEEERFGDWKAMHVKNREIYPDDPKLNPDVESRIGFTVAKNKMREVMLMDTANRLPEVLSSLRKHLTQFHEDLTILEGKKKFHDPNYLKLMIGNLMHDVCKRIADYLDGDLVTAAKNPEYLIDLDEELQLEEDSEWSDMKLGSSATTDEEDEWRNVIQRMFDEDTMPAHVGSDKTYLGGKQFQRAQNLLMSAMAEAFPDITAMKEYVASGAGYLQGGLQRENWERATLSIVKMTSSVTISPGINFFIKHAGSIFRRLFQVALMDTKRRSNENAMVLDICPGLEQRVVDEFDGMLWMLMENAARNTHVSLEPMFSILNPCLPGFVPIDEEEEEEDHYTLSGGSYVKTPSKSEIREEKMSNGVFSKLASFIQNLSIDERQAKQLLRDRGRELAVQKKTFLPENRTSMINDDETDKIILSAFQYVVALQELIQTNLNFLISHYVYQEFKKRIAIFPRTASNQDWSHFIPSDTELDGTIAELKNKITVIKASLGKIQKMQMQF
mmetsp:Transcript_3279/g.8360  ORF Transcript_3279/g.8360 Transcript_3279/m.8360 type:complete len:817 (-) Transcript_3279:296-2746(-)|eukprot:CAMPEP_0181095420 /NCGR_PEP_ID=MMETSP1071-20121207/10507_1 /TAXON_ID=35127 /ORGANISM="Thalassiosira sp., Strain NH16" /LENGTH=816 /DNA_ID=CAMNT_0023177795 /DNA_START=236 /DNA_END=2686 /DNA_ORIENTATION=-